MPPANPPRQREIRVFVSSTLRDMQGEREELVKQIFPQLRRLCESRGVTWGEVDLRWGIPDEAKAEGKALPLCLRKSSVAGRTSSACSASATAGCRRRFRKSSSQRGPGSMSGIRRWPYGRS
jgi:hypothetical protein